LPNRFAKSILQRSSSHRPRLADVARLAGVSTSTASFVINDVEHARVADETRARIWAAVEELGYRPNANARGLRTRRTETIGFVTDEIATSPFAGEKIHGAQDAAWAAGHLLLIANTEARPELERAAIETMLDRQVDGLIIAAMSTKQVDDPRHGAALPCVLLDCFMADASVTAVLPDEERGGREAGEILLEAGHRRIAFINGPHDNYASEARLRGFRAALERHGVDLDPELLRWGTGRPDGGYEHALRLLALPKPPSAIFCWNDRTAFGAFDAIKELGLRIPQDVSVLGYDDQDLAAYTHPALSTMALPQYEMGRWACERLLAGDSTPVRQLLHCPPVMRASVGPPRSSRRRGGAAARRDRKPREKQANT
jgi:LacI family transcriptional regulator, galactose operon repressor